MATRVFISFDYDHDAFLRQALVGQSRLDDSPFEVHDWSIKEPSWDWKEKARQRIVRSDVVAVICGHHTHLATGVDVEIQLARQANIPYFLLAGYSAGVNMKPSAALPADKLYAWNWPNLKSLIGGSR
ncbi:TIR domain-containing protein [Pseudarthrobacter sp. J75]|uniref:TIR domain-containing protein n=1 Tax=unclassified Pseudarthrobacter TaxID=2647000 RepID=UPI002E7FBE28|nr:MULTISPECIES: TIR domain-containing protein [unclassified Pseudarthrobacter]MEE2522395.1 TIR domain-containing protein [Pseudarthrobacter sp. J47]MEE2530428.1 TIR domain-containing protein [Pseudarthrobacter sp. J75]